jgi:hypothetical protein
MTPSTTGGCLCGGVRFELTSPAVAAGYCHCTRCQRRTGSSASATAVIERGSLRLVSGEDLLKAWTPDDGGFAKVFCGECGSHLFARPADREGADVAGVRMGAFDDDPGVRPGWRAFVAYAAPWEPIPDDGLERFPERRTS